MICSNCQQTIPDDSGFCTACGTAVAAPQPQMSAKQRGLKKLEFLKNEATPAVKKTATASMIIFGVLAVLIAVATILTISISFFNIPIVSAFMSESDRNMIDSSLDEAAYRLDEMEDGVLKKIEEEYGAEIYQKTAKLLKVTRKAANRLSLNNSIAMVDTYTEWVNTVDIDNEEIEELNLEGIVAEVEEVSSTLKTVRTIAYVFAIIIILLLLWAAACKITGLGILCIFLYVPVCALLSNVVIALVCFAGLIALAVTTSRVNKAWKKA